MTEWDTMEFQDEEKMDSYIMVQNFSKRVEEDYRRYPHRLEVEKT